MIVHTKSYLYFFSVSKLLDQRVTYYNKIHLKKKFFNLNFKNNIVTNIVAKYTKKGKFLKKYKIINKFYMLFILKNVKKLSKHNMYKYIHSLTNSFKDFNRVLVWKILSINPLFNLKIINKKKIVYYLEKKKRAHTVTRWIKYISKINELKKKSNKYTYCNTIAPILVTNIETNSLTQIKLKIYKAKFLKG